MTGLRGALFILFFNIFTLQLAQASPCSLLAAPDGRYHYLRNREERTVSAYVYWKQASTLVQTIQGLFEYGVCTPWAKSCLNGICQGVPGCDIREKNGKWALFRDGIIFSPWISEKEGGKEYLSEIFSVYKSGHICYEQTTEESTALPVVTSAALAATPLPTAESLATPTQSIQAESGMVLIPTSAPSAVGDVTMEQEAQAIQTSLAQVPAEEEEVKSDGAIPTMDLIQAPSPVAEKEAPVEATAAKSEEGMDPDSLPAEAFTDEETK